MDALFVAQSIGFGSQEVCIWLLQVCNREDGQALSREKCPVRTVDLEPELGDPRVGVAHLELFFGFIFYVKTHLATHRGKSNLIKASLGHLGYLLGPVQDFVHAENPSTVGREQDPAAVAFVSGHLAK